VLDLRRLRVLKAVVETGSISGAAAELSYTPSAVSQQIAALERETGAVLFEPAGRGVRPTDAALLLCEHASRALANVQEAEDALVALRSGQFGRMRVGAFPTAGSALVPAALAVFQAGFPRVALDLVVAEPDDGLHRRYLLADPFRAVLPRGHAMAARRTIDIKALAKERWISVTSCPGYCQQVVSNTCRQAGFDPCYGLEADEYPTAQGFVAAGLGVALVPLLALGAAVHPGVVVRRLSGEQPVRQIWAATRTAIAHQLPVDEMLRNLEQSAGEFLASQS